MELARAMEQFVLSFLNMSVDDLDAPDTAAMQRIRRVHFIVTAKGLGHARKKKEVAGAPARDQILYRTILPVCDGIHVGIPTGTGR